MALIKVVVDGNESRVDVSRVPCIGEEVALHGDRIVVVTGVILAGRDDSRNPLDVDMSSVFYGIAAIVRATDTGTRL